MAPTGETTYRRLRDASPAEQRELAAVMASYDDGDRYEEFVSWLAGEFATLDHKNRAYFVAEFGGVIVGFVRLWNSPHIREWVIDGVVVSPSRQRRGLGYRLLRDAMDLAARSGAPSVIVQVSKRNAPALALYEKVGFQRETTDYLNSYGQPRQGLGWQCRIKLTPPP